MDEIHDPLLHQWLCLTRLLMMIHPGLGVSMANMVISPIQGLFQYAPGWNRVLLEDELSARQYVFVNIDLAQTRWTPPDVPPEAIHTVQRMIPDLSQARLWAIMQALAEQLTQRNQSVYTPERIAQVMQNILGAFPPGRTFNPDVMKEKVLAALHSMKQAMTATQQGHINSRDFLMPAIEVVKAYLSFELPGLTAREVLAVILSTQCQIPILGPPTMTPLQARTDTIEHLGNLVYRLLQQRKTANVTSYCELTYLAGLYAGTAHVLTGHAIEVGGLPSEVTKRVQRLDLNLDEMFAHHVSPTFVLPALLSLRHILEWIVRESTHSNRSFQEIATEHCIHPGLQQLLESFEEMSDDTVLQAYQQFADASQSIDIERELTGAYSPITQSNHERIVLGLTALALGHQMN